MFDKINEICNKLGEHYKILNKPTEVTIKDYRKQPFSRTISKNGKDIGGIKITEENDNVTIHDIAISPEYRSRDHIHFRNAIAILFCDTKINKITIICPVDSTHAWEDIGVDINSDVADPELTRKKFFEINIKHIIKYIKIQ